MALRVRIGLAVAAIAVSTTACAWGPSVDRLQRVCDRANETRDVHDMADCYRQGGSLACRADQQTGRDEKCDEAVSLAQG